MGVYVDNVMVYPREKIAKRAQRYGNRWCHLYADSDAELDEFAQKIGLQQSWKQLHRFVNHFDLTPSQREIAIRAGAAERSISEWRKAALQKAQGEGSE